MDKLDSVVRFEGDNGEVFEMVILKEFEYNKKNYAVLMGTDECGCGDDCGDDCECEKCGETICIVEKTVDKNGNEVFKSIEDEKEYEELVEKADKLLFGE